MIIDIRRIGIIALILLSLIVLIPSDTAGQTATTPTRTQCRQWDDAFIATFNIAFWVTLFLTLLCSLLIPPLCGRFYWWLTRPLLRVVWISLIFLGISSLAVIVWPYSVGLGWLWFNGVDPKYLDCESVQFGASGLFDGLMGRGIAAIALWPVMFACLLIAAIVGGGLAIGTSKIMCRFRGIGSRVKEESA